MFGVDSFDSWKAKLEHNKGFLSRQDKKMTKHEKMSLDYIKFLIPPPKKTKKNKQQILAFAWTVKAVVVGSIICENCL